MFRKSFFALGLSLISNPANAQFIVPQGTAITYSNTVPIDIGGIVNGGYFTADYNCNSNVTSNSLNGGIVANQACINQLIRSGVGNNVVIAPSNAGASVSIGAGANPVTITQEGINVGGDSLINRRANGEIHIGENSLITVERNGIQELYATDANGNAIPINITNGTDLQINGTSVNTQLNNLNTTVNGFTNQINTLNNRVGNLENNVNNLGSGVAGATALTAALTALPATSDDSPVSCGVGSGGYSSRYAMGFGCAARVTERLAFNAGGSYVFGGASNYGGGTLDNVAGRLGFVFKIGKITPTSNQAISKRAEQLESQLSEVKQENQKLTAYLEDMKKLIAMQNERLGNLEKVANISGSQLSSQSLKPSPNLEVASSSR